MAARTISTSWSSPLTTSRAPFTSGRCFQDIYDERVQFVLQWIRPLGYDLSERLKCTCWKKDSDQDGKIWEKRGGAHFGGSSSKRGVFSVQMGDFEQKNGR